MHFQTFLPDQNVVFYNLIVYVLRNLACYIDKEAAKVFMRVFLSAIHSGTHSSGSHGIRPDSAISPDNEYKDFLNDRMAKVKNFLYTWWVTQATNLTEQLMGGIRDLDLRVAARRPKYPNGTLVNPGTPPEFFLVHGMYALKLKDELDEIVRFLRSHPGEVVIIDFRHLYDFTKASDYRRFKRIVRKVSFFG